MAAAKPLVAFYAPMKAPDHPVPSGDRTVARNYMKALEKAGFDVALASALRLYDGKGDIAVQASLRAAASAETEQLVSAWNQPGVRRPSLWFSYHNYHKAPDLIGPAVSREMKIPYVIAEPSHAPKRRSGPWSGFLDASEAAIMAADRLFVATAADLECLAPLRTDQGGLVRLPPFLDTEGWPDLEKPASGSDTCRLVTVAMMRPGDKLASYVLLAKALEMLEDRNWTLTIAGDGEARGEVSALFAAFGRRVRFTGEIADRVVLAQTLMRSDIFVWPAVNEAYGMAFLEASLMGLPVVAGDEGGVCEVVQHEHTGLLSPARDAAALSAHLARLMQDRHHAVTLGAAGRRFVGLDRSLESAATVLRNELFSLLKKALA